MTVSNYFFNCNHFDCVFYDVECEFCVLCTENKATNSI